jgi:hypothetical protein
MAHENVRRLVLASLGAQEPECGICLEKFTHADATVLECAHVTCKGCFQRLANKECPFCRHEFSDARERRLLAEVIGDGDDEKDEHISLLDEMLSEADRNHIQLRRMFLGLSESLRQRTSEETPRQRQISELYDRMHQLRNEGDLLWRRIEDVKDPTTHRLAAFERPYRKPWPSENDLLQKEEKLLSSEVVVLRNEKEWMEWYLYRISEVERRFHPVNTLTN